MRYLVMLFLLLSMPMMVYGQTDDGRVVHTVQRGETLQRIALSYDVPIQQIIDLNRITNPNRILVGQRLEIIPAQAMPEPENQPEAQNDETVIADVVEETVLADDKPAEATVETPQTITYVVQRGDSLGAIAQRYGIDWRTIARLNNIHNVNTILPGQRLEIPTNNQSDINIFAEDYYIPEPTITEGRQIIVSLSASRVYAFEDGELVRSVLVSLGKANTPTIPGDFEIYYRVRVQTMTGPGYSTPNVEWVLYYHQGYALHGAWWHENWGNPMSAGCVNMPNEDARWFWENFGDIGTPVSVIY